MMPKMSDDLFNELNAMQDEENPIQALDFLNNGSGVITLCGSTKFFTECMEANRQLTFKNWIVLMCGSWGHSYHKNVENNNTDYSRVKKLHYQKILISQAIVVVSDSTGYIGDSTKAEIAFARYRNIPVFYFDGSNFFGETEKTPQNELSDSSLIDSFNSLHGTLGF
jgi:hypothetical protein